MSAWQTFSNVCTQKTALQKGFLMCTHLRLRAVQVSCPLWLKSFFSCRFTDKMERGAAGRGKKMGGHSTLLCRLKNSSRIWRNVSGFMITPMWSALGMTANSA